MEGGNRISVALLVTITAAFAVATIHDRLHQKALAKADYERNIVHVAAAEVIGRNANFEGDPESPYTLVEFGDYECPPCRQAFGELAEILPKYRGKLKFVFRNLPLTTLHAYAMPAAEAAEAARIQGRFWPVHDALYKTKLSLRSIDTVIKQEKLNHNIYLHDSSARAKDVIEGDIETAHQLNLIGTPSFLLCERDGTVVHLQSLDDVSKYFK